MAVFKSDHPEEERYILGVVLEPNDGENGVLFNPDTQGDVYSAGEIRQAAHLFMEHYRNLGYQHQKLVTGGQLRILESYVSLVDMVVLPDGRAVGYPSLLEALESGKVEIPQEAQVIWRGTWLLGMRVVDDVLWSDFKAGRITGLSIGGSARRVKEPAPQV
jgi:DNA adenine methylase